MFRPFGFTVLGELPHLFRHDLKLLFGRFPNFQVLLDLSPHLGVSCCRTGVNVWLIASARRLQSNIRFQKETSPIFVTDCSLKSLSKTVWPLTALPDETLPVTSKQIHMSIVHTPLFTSSVIILFHLEYHPSPLGCPFRNKKNGPTDIFKLI